MTMSKRSKYQPIQLSKYQQVSDTNTWRWPSCSSKGIRTMWILCENALYGPQKLPFKRWQCWNIYIKPCENQPLWTTTVIWCPYINKYQYISTDINTYQQICSNITKYECISANINKYQYISTDITTYHQIYSNINKYECISTNIIAYQRISININTYIWKYPQASINVNKNNKNKNNKNNKY